MSTYYRGIRWSRYWLGLVFAGLIFFAGCASQTEQSSQEGGFIEAAGAGLVSLPGKVIEGSQGGLEDLSETSGYLLESATLNIEDWPRRILEDTKETFFRPGNMTALLLAGGASIAMHSSGADENLAENFDNPRVFHGFVDESINIIGSPWTHLGVSSLWYAMSAKNQDEFSKQRAGAMLRSLGVTSAITMGLKAIRDNESPNGKDWAWPSGHAA
ncbi:MAG: phosphatase PAP2 family protein, partial [Planctomycetota bacterium]